jgi:RNA polymerase sigma factor (TIGR02999 family)
MQPAPGNEQNANDPTDVTQLLLRWSRGDDAALQDLMPLVYEELRRLAASHIAHEHQDCTLQPTALVHEAYLRMVRQRNVSFESRLKFYGAAAKIMRRVLCDRARMRNAQKRGGGVVPGTPGADAVEIPAPIEGHAHEVVDLEKLDDALEELERMDERKARIVELRFFAGLTIADSAVMLDLSAATIKREWTVARAWLANRLRAV